MSERKQTFEGGATRTEQPGRYDLIPNAALDAMARRLALGAAKHGEQNWRKGGPEFHKASISHAMKHLADYAEFLSQDDLDGAICNLAFLCHFDSVETARAEALVGALVGASAADFERIDEEQRPDRHARALCGFARFDTFNGSIECLCDSDLDHAGSHRDTKVRVSWARSANDRRPISAAVVESGQ